MSPTMTGQELADQLLEFEEGAEKATGPNAEDFGQSLVTPADGGLESKVHSLEDAGYRVLYNTKTGEPSLFTHDSARLDLERSKFPDGSPCWSIRKPKIKRVDAQLLRCPLHPDNPEREHYNELGLPVCTKANIPNATQIRKHMKIKHPTALETIEAEKAERQRQEDRDWQRKLMESLAQHNRAEPSIVADEANSPEPEPEKPVAWKDVATRSTLRRKRK